MTRSIILHVEVDDPNPLALAQLAEDCADACERAGIPVQSAAPWNAEPASPVTLVPPTVPSDPNTPPPLF